MENDLEQEILALMRHPDRVVNQVLLPDQDSQDDFLMKIQAAQTESQLREVLILELLLEKMKENSDWNPLAK